MRKKIFGELSSDYILYSLSGFPHLGHFSLSFDMQLKCADPPHFGHIISSWFKPITELQTMHLTNSVPQ